jgi:CSLREA domain-containing protein
MLQLEVDDARARYPLTIDPTFSQQVYLKASNTGASDFFGTTVAISGDTAVIGASNEDSSAAGVNGDQGNNDTTNAGAAYVFVRHGNTWTQQAYLKASNPDFDDRFGGAVAIAGDTVVVGAQFEDSQATGVDGSQGDNSANAAGAAYVFVRTGNVWTQQAYLKASNTDAGDQFGRHVALSGDTVVVGAPLEDSNATGVNSNDQANNDAMSAGAAYVFVRNGNNWAQQAYLKASNTDAVDVFANSVATSGDTVVVGADGEDSGATGVNGNQGDNSANAAGAAYVFVRAGHTWAQQAYLKASNTERVDSFGDSVAISADTVVIGASFEDSNGVGVNGNTQGNNDAMSAGAAYVFVRSGSTWTQQAYLKASNTDAFDQFGKRVAISGDLVAIGASGEDSNATGVNGNQGDNSVSFAGATYVFVRSGDIWIQQAYLKSSGTDVDDYFGDALALSGDSVLVGAPFEDSGAVGVNGNPANNDALNSGAAYVYTLAALRVTTLADEQNANGRCSLREALINANQNDQSGSNDCAAGFGTDTIRFEVTGQIGLSSALPNILDPLIIDGPGPDLLQVRRTAAALFRVFTVGSTSATLSGLAISGGDVGTSEGGGIQNFGHLVIRDSEIFENRANGGGGIDNRGILTLTSSTLRNNVANFDGGALYNTGTNAVATLRNCTISGNTGGSGNAGGIMSATGTGQSASLSLEGCTLSGNSGSSVRLRQFAAGASVTAEVRNSIVVPGSGGTSVLVEAGTTLTSRGFNLLGDSGGGVFTQASDRINTNPLLFALAGNGGFTFTHALQAGSPARDAGNSGGGSDQPGSLRPVDLPNVGNATGSDGSDIGAVEMMDVCPTSAFPTPINWWRAENNGNDAVGSANATVTAPAGFASGRVGQGFNFTGIGNGVVRLPDNLFDVPSSGTSKTGLSFELWFSTTTGGVILGQQPSAPFGVPTGYTPAIYVGGNGRLHAQMFWKGNADPIMTSFSVNDGLFHHVAVIHDGTRQSLYVDGLLIGSKPHTETAFSTETLAYQFGAGVALGWPNEPAAGSDGWSRFSGRIDEAARYNRPLSATEVLAIYLARERGKLAITPLALPNGQVGSAYNQALGVQGSGGPYSFALIPQSGALPAGLTLSSAGVISGTPSAMGAQSFSVRAVNAAGCSTSTTQQLRISPPDLIFASRFE